MDENWISERLEASVGLDIIADMVENGGYQPIVATVSTDFQVSRYVVNKDAKRVGDWILLILNRNEG